MNREKRWAFATACLCMIGLVTACSPRRATATLIVQTEDAPTLQMNLAAEILAQRFLEIRPSMFSTITPTVSGNTITFTYRGEAPPNDTYLRPLALTRGVLRITPADHPDELWVSDLDVVDVKMMRSASQGPILTIRVTPQAGSRLMEATTKNTGRTLVTTCDGRMIVSATIRAPFGTAFVLPVPSVEEGHVLLNVLRHGRLPVAVRAFDYRLPGRDL